MSGAALQASVGFSFDESRPYLTVAGNISAMAINGKGVTDANQVLKHVRPGQVSILVYSILFWALSRRRSVECVDTQVIMTGPSWEAMLKKMPDETRPLDLGTYKLISSEPAMKLIEVQVRLSNRCQACGTCAAPDNHLLPLQIRQLQNRKFPALPSALQEEAGFMDAPDGEDGIAYLMCQAFYPDTLMALACQPHIVLQLFTRAF